MRPIKFRAWDEENKCFWYSDSDNEQEYCIFNFHKDGVSIHYGVYRPYLANGEYIDQVDNETLEIETEKIMQFTGLLDKNGVEIYEGDWCRAEFRTKDGIQVIQGNIIMDEFMWCIDCTGSVGDDVFSINRPHNFEVIGNIHENNFESL